MPDLLPNQDELNRKCKEFLLELKEDADPSQLYCLQLMQWSLEKGIFRVKDDRLRNTLDHLLGEPPNLAYRFLKLAEGGEEYPVVPDLDQLKNPEDLAWELLNVLDSKVSLHLKGAYPRQTPGL